MCCWASATMSPRCSRFSAQRCLKSEGDQSRKRCVTVDALTYGPFRLLPVCFVCQFAVHLVETLDCVRYAIGHFEMVAKSAINRKPRGCKLQTNRVSSQRGAPEQRGILTLRAASKASLHEPRINFNFAHSLKSGVGHDEWRVVSTLLSWAERHLSKKSVVKC